MLDGTSYSSTSDCFSNLQTTISKKKQSKNNKRFDDEQIRSLEVMFESETKLEPRKKVELAKELRLQPRQVAIWFQNKRARWKSKQIEKDYNVLLVDYNNLTSQFESLQKENQTLLIQKVKNELAGNQEMESQIQEKAGNNFSDGESDYGKMDFKVGNDGSNYFVSDEDGSVKAGELLELDEETKLLKKADSASLTSGDRDWGNVDCDDLINQPTQWWDFCP